MRKILAIVAALMFFGGNAWAQDRPTYPQDLYESTWDYDGTLSFSFFQPIAHENEFRMMVVGFNVSLLEFGQKLNGKPRSGSGHKAHFLTVGLGAGIRKAEEYDSRNKRSTLTDLYLNIYPLLVPLDLDDDSDGTMTVHFSPGVTRNLTHGGWGFIVGFSFVYD